MNIINFIEYFSYKLESYMYLVKIKKYWVETFSNICSIAVSNNNNNKLLLLNNDNNIIILLNNIIIIMIFFKNNNDDDDT